MSFVILALTAWMVSSAVMVLVWFLQRRTGSAGVVDVVWSFGVGAVAVVFSVNGSGAISRRVLIATLAGAWAVRLGIHLWKRTISEAEDGRYTDMRQRYGGRVQAFFFGFYQLQALWVVLFALPMALAAENAGALGWLDGAAVVVWSVALVGETVADRQLSRFREDPSKRGEVCQEGLWRYSRHPNYFFEWIHWWSYVLLALGAPYGWIAVLGPVVMLFFLLKVTGIPPTEARAVQSRGEAYRRYQATTSAFLPWLPKAKECVR